MAETNQNDQHSQNVENAANSGRKRDLGEPSGVSRETLPCESSSENTILRSGFGTFFTDLFDYDFVTQFYFGLYSRNGVRFNRLRALIIFKRIGILNYQFLNPRRERINLQVLKSCNEGYQDLTNAEAVEKFLREGICLNCIIDNLPTQECGEASDTFPIPDVPLAELSKNIPGTEYGLRSSRASPARRPSPLATFPDLGGLENLDFDEFPTIEDIEDAQTSDYSFFTDVVNWPYVAFSNPQIQKYGLIGNGAVIQWFMEEAIYNNVQINPYGSRINLNYVVEANNLTELKTYDQVVSWILQYGNTDPNAIIATPELQTNNLRALRSGSYSRNGRIAKIINDYVKNNLVSQNYIPPTPEASQTYVFPPSAPISGTPSAASAPPPTSNANFQSGAEVPQFVNGTRIRNFFGPFSRFNSSSAGSNATQQQQEVIISETAPAPSTSSAQYASACVNCKRPTESFSTPTSNPGTEVPPTCQNCVTQVSAFGPLGRRRGFITPVSLSVNPSGPILNGSLGQSILLSPSTSNTDAINNASGASNIFGGGRVAAIRSRFQTYFNTRNTPSFTNPNNLVYFS